MTCRVARRPFDRLALEIPAEVLASTGQFDRFLLLDFDGVLHPAQAHAELGSVRPPLKEQPAAGLFIHTDQLAEQLTPYAAVGLVVHSSWRMTHIDAELRSLLGPVGDRLVGATDRGLNGELSILQFARRLRLDPSMFRVLDDQPELLPHLVEADVVIACDPARGVSDQTAREGLEYWLASSVSD